MNKQYYIGLFAKYPDVVNLEQFREMLGGIGINTARKLVQTNKVRHFYIRCTYYIPKEYIINYVLSKHYNKYKKMLKVQV